MAGKADSKKHDKKEQQDGQKKNVDSANSTQVQQTPAKANSEKYPNSNLWKTNKKENEKQAGN